MAIFLMMEKTRTKESVWPFQPNQTKRMKRALTKLPKRRK